MERKVNEEKLLGDVREILGEQGLSGDLFESASLKTADYFKNFKTTGYKDSQIEDVFRAKGHHISQVFCEYPETELERLSNGVYNCCHSLLKVTPNMDGEGRDTGFSGYELDSRYVCQKPSPISR